MKCARIMVGFKYCYQELFSLVHPSSVSQVKMNGIAIPDHVLRSIMGFLALYIGLCVICTMPVAAKCLLSWCMLLGRLEIYTVIILFVPEFWKK